MEKYENICQHCGNHSDSPHQDPKSKNTKLSANKKIIFKVVIILTAFVLEGVFLWAFAESRIAYSPVQADLEIPIKKDRNRNDSLSTQLVAKIPPKENQQSSDSLVIPKLNLNSPVEYVGKTANGEMATSKSLYNVALYSDGANPGENGSVVLAGHYGGPYEKGVFRSADKLSEGDTIEYRFKDGRTIKYKVLSRSSYKVADMPLKNIFNKSDNKYLNLITCYGNWDRASSTYDQRLVVYAKEI